jgi:hypothetical protein
MLSTTCGPPSTFGNTDATSHRWANTDYYSINSGVNGWTFGSDTYVAKETDTSGVLTGHGALLLNEPSGVATRIIRLSVGQQYQISLLLSGDNRPGRSYVFNISIGSDSWTELGTDLGPGLNPGIVKNYVFTANSTSELLTLSESSERKPPQSLITYLSLRFPNRRRGR